MRRWKIQDFSILTAESGRYEPSTSIREEISTKIQNETQLTSQPALDDIRFKFDVKYVRYIRRVSKNERHRPVTSLTNWQEPTKVLQKHRYRKDEACLMKTRVFSVLIP